ncbi:MAG: hypothetical protein JXM79_16560 [Sedimentisphaerales bacterium]|nr:hypothetical protein [Sedimentisphaerales bacterium]
MKKVMIFTIVVSLLLSLTAIPIVMAAGPNGPAGKSNTGHLNLYEKDPATWEIVEGGANGKMTYNLSGSEFEFVFNGHGLEAEVEYRLIYYPDPWPGNGLICLGCATANGGGNVHIQNSVDTGDLPAAGDENADPSTTTYPDGIVGAKIWLVPADDVECDSSVGTKMIGWNPAQCLFEGDLISFDDTDE